MYFKRKYIALLCVCALAFFQSYALADGIFNIKNYGATGDGHTLDTKGINNAIAACVKAGGGTVLVPAGTFVTGTFQLFSNIDLYLAPGSVILASENTNDYLLQTDYGFKGSGAGGKKLGIVFAVNAVNVSITGTGTIDGRASAFMFMDSVQVSSPTDSKYARQGSSYMDTGDDREQAPVMWKGEYANRPGTQIIFHNCKKVLLRDINVRNANDWTIDLNACDDAKVLGISIDNNLSVPNSDGIDMYDSRNVIISNCDVRAGDDAIAVISTSNLAVTNCNLHSRSCGIRIGYNAFNDNNSGNLLFDNIRIYGSNRGIGIFQRRKGNIENMVFSNMIIDTHLYPAQWWGHGEPIHISALPGIGSEEVGTISHLRFTNIIASGEEGIVLYGSKESTLQDILFDNVQITISKGRRTANNAGNFDLRPTNDPKLSIFKHDIPALYARYIQGLTIKDFKVQWDSSLPGYFNHAISCDHFQQLVIEGFQGTAAHGAAANESIIDLSEGKDAKIKNLQTTNVASDNQLSKQKPLQWVSQQNVSNLDLARP